MSRTPSVLLLLACVACNGNGNDTLDTGDFGTDPIVQRDDCLPVAGSLDSDGDGVVDHCDECVGDDALGDLDNDGICDDQDPCADADSPDTDGDGVCDQYDVCVGDDYADDDGDGYPCATDCDDTDPAIFPTAAWYADEDGDGHGDFFSNAVVRCDGPEGFVRNSRDCDDSSAAVNPDSEEWCDGVDTDCRPNTPEPTAVAHAFTEGVWTDLTADFENGPVSWSSTGDGLIGICGLSTTAHFDIQHDVEVRAVGSVSLIAGEEPVFDVSAGGSLHASNLQISGTTDGLITINGGSADVWDSTFLDLEPATTSEALIADVTDGWLTLKGVYATGLGARAIRGHNSTLTLLDTELSGFTAASNGGTIAATASHVDIDSSGIRNTSAAGNGGAIYHTTGSVRVRATTIRNATATGDGGALHTTNSWGDLNGASFVDNDGLNGGGVYAQDARLLMSGSLLEDNSAISAGGGLYCAHCSVLFDGTTMAGNRSRAGGGGAVFQGNSRVSGRTLILRNNRSRTIGGGMHVSDSLVHLQHSQLVLNHATDASGAYITGSRVALDGSCSVLGNFALPRFTERLRAGAVTLWQDAEFFSDSCDYGATSPTPPLYGTRNHNFIRYYNYDPDPNERGWVEEEYNIDIVTNNADRAIDFPGDTPTGWAACGDTVCETDFTMDDDDDGVPDEYDVLAGVDDMSDGNGDGLPVLFESLDVPGCPFGAYDDADLGCVQDTCEALGETCPITATCADLHVARPDLPSGLYRLLVGGAPSYAVCDMDTDGGGWTLVANYTRDPSQDITAQPLTERLPRLDGTVNAGIAGSPAYGHANPGLLATLNPTELRFYATSDAPSPDVIHFTTTHPGTLTYLTTGSGSAEGLEGAFTALADHTSSLPANATSWTSDAGDTAMTDNLLYAPNTAYWSVRGGGEFQVGDFRPALGGGSPHVTQHRVWAR